MEVLEIQQIFMTSAHAQDFTILCSTCGSSFPSASTGSSVCLNCLTTQTDITIGITKQAVLNFCRTCTRYLRPPWVYVEPESKGMLALCLRRIKGLNKVKLIDASFIWTEPHSQRVKVKLTIQKVLANNISLQQTFPIEFVVQNQQCEDCKKEYMPDMWRSLVQLRQKADHKKALFLLEQLILKHNIHEKVLKIKDVQEGMDFFYKDKTDASRLLDLLQSTFCVKVKHSKQLASQDLNNNATSNYKHIISIDLPRVWKDDLVVISPKLASELGSGSPVLVCTNVTTVVQFIDPISMKSYEMNNFVYFKWEEEMLVISAKNNLTEFIVNEIEDCNYASSPNSISAFSKAVKTQISRKGDWREFEVTTYLGNNLKEGNCVSGYDLTTLNLNLSPEDITMLGPFPEIILVKKSYTETPNGKRIWRLKRLDKEESDSNLMFATQIAKDYEEFLNDIETDKEMRLHINLYRNEKAIKDKENDRMDNENGNKADKNQRKSIKKQLKVRRRSRKGPQVATEGQGQDRDDKDHDDKDDGIQEERKEEDGEEQEKKGEDPMVQVEELLADLTLEDQEMGEDESDAIEEFIRRLERVRIEGKE